MRRQKLAGLKARAVLTAEACQQLALGIDDRQPRSKIGRLQVDGHARTQFADHEGRRFAAATVKATGPMQIVPLRFIFAVAVEHLHAMVLPVGDVDPAGIVGGDIVGDVAIASGYDVKKTDTLGMAQRGGSVVSHLRMAEKVFSPMIAPGTTDILISFEKLESVRWVHFVKPNGLVIINDHVIPLLSVSLGKQKYPSDSELDNILKQRTDNIYYVKGTEKAQESGDVRVLNIFMLGYMSVFMPFETDVWKECLRSRLPAKILDMNLVAFDLGIKESSSVNIR